MAERKTGVFGVIAEDEVIKKAYIADHSGIKVSVYPLPNSTHAVTASAPMHDDHDYNSPNLFAVGKTPAPATTASATSYAPQWLDKAREVLEAKDSYADQKQPASDPVNHPSHYKQGKIEVLDFIEDQKFGYLAGQVIKYVARARHKGAKVQDYKKAEFYLKRLLARNGIDFGEKE